MVENREHTLLVPQCLALLKVKQPLLFPQSLTWPSFLALYGFIFHWTLITHSSCFSLSERIRMEHIPPKRFSVILKYLSAARVTAQHWYCLVGQGLGFFFFLSLKNTIFISGHWLPNLEKSQNRWEVRVLPALMEAEGEQHVLYTSRTHAWAFESDREAQRQSLSALIYDGSEGPKERQKVSQGGGIVGELASAVHKQGFSGWETHR